MDMVLRLSPRCLLTLFLQTVEMLVQRAGFRPGERAASISRKRFRVTLANTSAPPNMNMTHPDTSLWLTQYTDAEPQDRVPVANLRLGGHVRAILNDREMMKQRELMRKEFMLYDRDHWPKINPMAPHPTLAQQGVATHAAHGPPAAKRQKQMTAARTSNQASLRAMKAHFVEEDTSIGDVMDYLTPREISQARFKQHAEWMEEIFSSPYETGAIVPPDLGLGRKGELESLTRAFFDAPTQVEATSAGPVGKMDGDKALDFKTSVMDKLAQIDTDIQAMRRKHAHDIAEIQKGSQVKACLQRSQAMRALDAVPGQDQGYDALVNQFQSATGGKIKAVKESVCVQRGGLEEKTVQDYRATKSQDQRNTAMDSQAAFDHSQDHMVQDDQGAVMIPASSTGAIQAADDSNVPLIADHDMEMETDQLIAQGPDTTQEDWVMVGNDENSGPNDSAVPPGNSATTAFAEDQRVGTGTGEVGLSTDHDVTDFSANAVPGTGGPFDTTTFDDHVDFGNLDTAGDALAGFTPGDTGLSLEDQGDLGLDNSAFGDAFHADTGTSPGQDHGMPDPNMQL